MNINLEQYKIFYVVAKNESITRAANELMISQPAVSMSIKSLEDQLNTALFTRKRDGVSLTEAGEIIFEKIKGAIELIDSAEDDLKFLTNMESGTINIGASNSIVHEYLMGHLEEFHTMYPNINVRIFSDKINILIEKAKLGLIDIIFSFMPIEYPKNFETMKILELHDCFAASSKYNYLKDKKISLKDLEVLPLLLFTKGTITRNIFDDLCIEKNIKIKPIMEFTNNTLIKDFTLSGFGIGMLTEEYIKQELNEGKLFKLNIKLPVKGKYLGLAIDSSKKESIITKKFIDYIKNTIN